MVVYCYKTLILACQNFQIVNFFNLAIFWHFAKINQCTALCTYCTRHWTFLHATVLCQCTALHYCDITVAPMATVLQVLKCVMPIQYIDDVYMSNVINLHVCSMVAAAYLALRTSHVSMHLLPSFDMWFGDDLRMLCGCDRWWWCWSSVIKLHAAPILRAGHHASWLACV